MTIVHEAIKNLESIAKGSGCEDGNVALSVNYDAHTCQYPKGVSMEACFGGRRGQFLTSSPTRAATRVSFMFGAGLGDIRQRAAAITIINAVMSFFCLARKTYSCTPDHRTPCLQQLKQELSGLVIYPVGPLFAIEREFAGQIAESAASADVIVVGGDGLVTEAGLATIDEFRGKKRIVFLGPSASGVCALLNLEHWCPYGQ